MDELVFDRFSPKEDALVGVDEQRVYSVADSNSVMAT
jgi:hypothetical protein